MSIFFFLSKKTSPRFVNSVIITIYCLNFRYCYPIHPNITVMVERAINTSYLSAFRYRNGNKKAKKKKKKRRRRRYISSCLSFYVTFLCLEMPNLRKSHFFIPPPPSHFFFFFFFFCTSFASFDYHSCQTAACFNLKFCCLNYYFLYLWWHWRFGQQLHWHNTNSYQPKNSPFLNTYKLHTALRPKKHALTILGECFCECEEGHRDEEVGNPVCGCWHGVSCWPRPQRVHLCVDCPRHGSHA